MSRGFPHAPVVRPVAWDEARGVFLIGDAARRPERPPPHPPRPRAWEIALLLVGLATWCVVFLPGVYVLVRDLLR